MLLLLPCAVRWCYDVAAFRFEAFEDDVVAIAVDAVRMLPFRSVCGVPLDATTVTAAFEYLAFDDEFAIHVDRAAVASC